jgi:hypothetical protein
MFEMMFEILSATAVVSGIIILAFIASLYAEELINWWRGR